MYVDYSRRLHQQFTGCVILDIILWMHRRCSRKNGRDHAYTVRTAVRSSCALLYFFATAAVYFASELLLSLLTVVAVAVAVLLPH